MGSKQDTIIEKAIEVFTRYGVRKATMGDIASHAQISRQTLYSSYKNKDEILVAAVKCVADETISDIKKAWSSKTSIDEMLDVYMEFAIVRHYEIVRQMPDANDLLTGFSEKGEAAMKAAEDEKQALLKKQFQSYASLLKAKGSSPNALAEFFVGTSYNYKFIAQDMNHLKRLLGSLKLATLVMLGEK